MARSKSTSGGKTNKEQTSTGNPTSVPDVQAVAAETTAIQPEAKLTPEPRKKIEVVKSEPRRVVPINLEDEIRRRAYEPVSYTHLDVYKRQLFILPPGVDFDRAIFGYSF